MPFISIVTPCYNEEENIEELYHQIKSLFKNFSGYNYEHIFIDNASTDNTVPILKKIAKEDKNVKIIVNARNFGHIRSPYYALLQARGDAVINIAADLQDPPSLILEFIKKWEAGYKIVVGVKKISKESYLMFRIRKLYYKLLNFLSEIELIENFTGFGLYDRKIIEILKKFDDPYPYFRGLICEIGFEKAKIEYVQPRRKKGESKNNFYTLYDIAMLGIIKHSKIPLRIATILGFSFSIISFLIALGYFIYKLLFWERFSVGIAPIVIGGFFIASIQLFFLGIIGEYVGFMYTHVLKKPLVIEKERINFDE